MTFVIASDSEAISAIIQEQRVSISAPGRGNPRAGREIASASQERWLRNDLKMDIRQGAP